MPQVSLIQFASLSANVPPLYLGSWEPRQIPHSLILWLNFSPFLDVTHRARTVEPGPVRELTSWEVHQRKWVWSVNDGNVWEGVLNSSRMIM